MNAIKQNLLNFSFLLAACAVIATTVLLFKTDVAKGAVSSFIPATCYTAAATTTQSYMTAGAATTTITCALGVDGAQTAVLNTIFAASSTIPVLNINVEYSQDGVDYFSDHLVAATSSTQVADLRGPNKFVWTFASSTQGGVAASNAPPCFTGQLARGDCDHKSILINTPARYVRVIYSMTGGAGAIWGQILPRENVN